MMKKLPKVFQLQPLSLLTASFYAFLLPPPHPKETPTVQMM